MLESDWHPRGNPEATRQVVEVGNHIMQTIHHGALSGLILVETSTVLISMLGACSATLLAFK